MMSRLVSTVEANTKSNEARFQQVETTLRNHDSSLRNLENQVGQIARILTERLPGTLPSTTEPNPGNIQPNHREHCNAILVKIEEEPTDSDRPEQIEEEVGSEELVPEENAEPEQSEEEVGLEEPAPEEHAKEYAEEDKDTQPPPPSLDQEVQKQKDRDFSVFLEKMKKLSLVMTFMEMLKQQTNHTPIPTGTTTTRCGKDKDELKMLSESCNAIICNKLPIKLEDPGSFTVPCIIRNVAFSNVLCDLGSSINLMPYSTFQKLGLGKMQPTSMTLQLADRSLPKPLGVVKDVPVKVGRFIFLVDFVILQYEEDKECPLIFGRPFLNTGHALVDVSEGKLTLRCGEDSEEFTMGSKSQASSSVGQALKDKPAHGVDHWHAKGMDDKEAVSASALKKGMVKMASELEPGGVVKTGTHTQQLRTKQIYAWVCKHECKVGEEITLFNVGSRTFPSPWDPNLSKPFIISKVTTKRELEVENTSGDTFTISICQQKKARRSKGRRNHKRGPSHLKGNNTFPHL